MNLNRKQKQFVAEYLVDLNASAAAVRSGYSKKNADSIASRLLAKPAIKKIVTQKLKELEDKTQLTAELVREKVLAMLTFDPRKACGDGGKVLSLKDIPNELIDSITVIEEETLAGGVGFIKKIKFTDRLRVAELAAKIIGMLKLEVTGKDGSPLVPPSAVIDFSGISTEELKEAIGMYARANGNTGNSGK